MTSVTGMRSWTVVLGTALMILLSACSQDQTDVASGAASPAPAESPDVPFPDASRAEPARVTVTVTGDLSLTWEGESELRIVTLTPEEESANIFSVGFEELHTTITDGERFRWAFDVLGAYNGAGTYMVPAGGGQGPQPGGLETGLRSSAFLLHVTLAEGVDHGPPYTEEELLSATAYDQVLQDCTIIVSDDEATGTVDCPELANNEGHTISMDVTWELLGP